MPTRTDITVVNQAYDTSGNGGRKLVRLSNGWLVAAVIGNGNIYLYKSEDNGNTWAQLCYIDNASYNYSGVSIQNKGNIVYILATLFTTNGYVDFYKIDATTQTNVNIQWNTSYGYVTLPAPNSASYNAFNGLSLAINDSKTELHMTVSAKLSTHGSSFNIVYAKGTINADGSVTWGTVEQTSILNGSGYYIQNPSIVVKNNKPYIFAESCLPQYGYQRIIMINKDGGNTMNDTGSGSVMNTEWYYRTVYQSNYAQSSPSACVDKNGRIWVAWHGRDATDTTADNIRVSYSDDGGVTWSSMTKLTSGTSKNNVNASITVNKQNEVFVYYSVSGGGSSVELQKYNGSWSVIKNINFSGSNGYVTSPSTLLDTTLSFSEPLMIYSTSAINKVTFYGTWVITTISVTQGYIGQKTSSDKSNILSYSITTDGTMGTITEKINGTVINTRTSPTSGQQFTVNLSQAQWDAIKFGNGHTLTIEMGGDTWTYTFDKRLNANDDILSAVKGVQDLQTHLNAIKAQLGAAIRSKGGTVNDTDAWSAFVSSVSGLKNVSDKRWAKGSVTVNKTPANNEILTTLSLNFTPKTVITGFNNGGGWQNLWVGSYELDGTWRVYSYYSYLFCDAPTSGTVPIKFCQYGSDYVTNLYWIAIE